MATYIVRRLIQFVFILFGLSIVFFLILHLTPGGPCAALQQGGAKGEAQFRICIEKYGLNKPLVVQYALWIGGYLHGDFGQTLGGLSVASEFQEFLPVTILLATVSYALQLMIAIPLGIFSALKQYSFFDSVFTFVSYVGLSTPTFWLGLVLLYVFAVHWPIFPAGRVNSPTLPLFWTPGWFDALKADPGYVLGDLAQHLVLPAFTLMFIGIATDSRFMRASMLDVINQDYIRTAKAKGLKRRTVIFKHAFRNAVLPIVTNVALFLPALVGGFVITETVFSYTGIGYTFITSLQASDYAFVQAFLMLSALAVLVANLLADIVYALVDPRIRYD